MYLIVKNKVIEKDRLTALLSFIAGFVFFLGIFIQATQIDNFSFLHVLAQLGKITCQSNLLAFFTAGLYLFRPHHRFFYTNALPLFSISILWFAGFGFWGLLFPLYYIDLGNLIIAADEPQGHVAMFYALWNHTVTQIFFIVFFYFLNKKKNLALLVPVSTRKILNYTYCYVFGWVAWNILASFLFSMFPTYGILTNFNPYNEGNTQETELPLFNFRFLILSHIFCFVLVCSISAAFSLLAIKWRASHKYELLGYLASKEYVPVVSKDTTKK